MSAIGAFVFMSRLLGFALVLQSLELLTLVKRPAFFQIWSFENLSHDLAALPFSPQNLSKIFSRRVFTAFVRLQLVMALFLILYPNFVVLLILFILVLFTSIRFRGLFNGGSDMMTIVILTGALIASFKGGAAGYKIGLYYVAIHALYSYFKAGISKLRNRQWRRGVALPEFLNQSLYPDVRRLASLLRERQSICQMLTWAVLIFELAAVAIPFAGTKFALVYCGFAMAFHLANYFAFGLNRFFWIWLAVWPAIMFVSQR